MSLSIQQHFKVQPQTGLVGDGSAHIQVFIDLICAQLTIALQSLTCRQVVLNINVRREPVW